MKLQSQMAKHCRLAVINGHGDFGTAIVKSPRWNLLSQWLQWDIDNKDASGENNLIGQILSPKSGKQYVWEGEADSRNYTIKEGTDSQLIIPRGTSQCKYLWLSEPEVEFRSIFYVPPVSPIGQDDVVCIMKKCLVEKASECRVHVRDVPNDEECGVSVHEDKYVMNSLLVSLRTLSGL
ncbi:hypothetical protein IGI04_015454 [Brassica rapa subsp. trilocularis]|uniref:Uncharacterized protein n=1 Tax=Brassica rapa subsp. trilocularis TaxID=1813537 RepID=A0ABQ7MQ36_BRACM|nr:hypothetical protein IGI04_015454 [Brassica rapa subsp. trilocularis]